MTASWSVPHCGGGAGRTGEDLVGGKAQEEEQAKGLREGKADGR